MTRDLIVTMLKTGVLNRNNCGSSLWGIDLSGEDFSNCYLRGIDFTRANLTGCNFENAHLDQCIFTRASLPFSNLTGATATHAIFMYANLAHTTCIDTGFYGALMQRCCLTGADLTNANLDMTDFQHVDVENAIYSRVGFKEALINGTELIKEVV